MRIALLVCLLCLITVNTGHAQQSRAQVAASVTIVEAIGVTAGATAVTQANGGSLDVTTPLSIRGSAPRVVQVVDGDRARPISAQVRPACAPGAPAQSDECAVRARLTPADAREDRKLLTYLIATVN